MLAVSRKFTAPCMNDVCEKTSVVLHFTAGSTAAGAVATWGENFRVKKWALGTAYIVDRDGVIYEVFPPQNWAYHLGADVAQEKRTIGIELVNWGPLNAAGGNYSPLNFSSILVPASEVITAPYRNAKYWQKFPSLQAYATNNLVSDLCDKFGISRAIPDASWRAETNIAAATSFRGVQTHVNFRTDKYDIGPAWDWGATEKVLQSKMLFMNQSKKEKP